MDRLGLGNLDFLARAAKDHALKFENLLPVALRPGVVLGKHGLKPLRVRIGEVVAGERVAAVNDSPGHADGHLHLFGLRILDDGDFPRRLQQVVQPAVSGAAVPAGQNLVLESVLKLGLAPQDSVTLGAGCLPGKVVEAVRDRAVAVHGRLKRLAPRPELSHELVSGPRERRRAARLAALRLVGELARVPDLANGLLHDVRAQLLALAKHGQPGVPAALQNLLGVVERGLHFRRRPGCERPEFLHQQVFLNQFGLALGRKVRLLKESLDLGHPFISLLARHLRGLLHSGEPLVGGGSDLAAHAFAGFTAGPAAL